MIKTFDILLELENKSKNLPFTVSQNDLNAIRVNMAILTDGIPLNIAGITSARIAIKKPSGLSVIQDCEIVDSAKGKISVILSTQAYVEIGKHDAEIYLYEGDTVSVTSTFSYTSKKAILDNGTVTSTNDWQSINDALIQIDGNITRIENADVYTKSEADVKLAEKAKQTDVNNALALKSDKTYVDTQLGTTNATVALKADKTYVDTQLADKATQAALNATNANVSANTLAITNIGNGSPKGTYATVTALQTAFPTGTTGIYVVTADGKWYFWNGSAWTAGGTYQSTGIVDSSIQSDQLIKNSVTPFDLYNQNTINLFNYLTVTSNTYVDNNGTVATLSGFYLSDFIPVQAGETYTVTSSLSSQGGFYDSNKTWVAKIPQASTNTLGGYKFVVPTGVSYIRMNLQGTGTYMVIRGNKYPSKYYAYGEKIKLDWIQNPVGKQVVGAEQMINGINVNLFDKSTITTGSFIDNTGVTVVNAGFAVSDFIPVVENQTYIIPKGLSSAGAMYDVNKNWITSLPHPVSTQNTPWAFTVPWGCAYVKLNLTTDSTSTFMMALGNSYPSSYSSYGVTIPWLRINQTQQQTGSKWTGKKWGVVGDSITEKNFRTSKNYHDYIADKISCSVLNYGISGTGWRTPSSGGSLPIYQRISSMDSTLDLITVFAGTNDWGQTGTSLVLGTFGDTTTSTFYGAVDNVIKQLVAKYTSKTIAVFTPLQRSDGFVANSAGVTLEQIADAIIKVANKYGIPVLDLYRNNNLNVWDSTSNDYYFKAVGQSSPDGLHPNDAGHMSIADKILAFINSL